MDIFRTFLFGLALTVVIISPVLAQDDDEVTWVEFESESGLIKISHPEDWFITTSGAMEDPTAFTFANSEELLSRILNGDDEAMTEGDKMGTVGVFPAAWSNFLGIPAVDDMSPEEMVEALAIFFFGDDPEWMPEFGNLDVVEKEGEPSVGIVPISREATAIEGLWFAYFRDDYIIFGFVAAYTGEFDDDYQALAIDMILTYEITITADELIERVMEE